MPYIKQRIRDVFKVPIEVIKKDLFVYVDDIKDSALAYIFYKLLKDTYGVSGSWSDKVEAIKILEDVKLEYYRRIIAPYSDIKIEQNGDV